MVRQYMLSSTMTAREKRVNLTQQFSLAKPEDGQAGPRVGTVATTIAILRLLSKVGQPIGVNAIARRLDRSPSSCFNILKTLMAEGFVEVDPETKAYSLGSGMIAIARRALDPNATFELLRNRIEDFAGKRSLTMGLWRVLRRSRIMLVGYVASATSMRIHLTVGQRLPWLIGGAGRCIAATTNLPKGQIADEFAKLRWQEPLSLESYLEQVELARQRGWGLDEGYFVRGVTTIATPIVDSSGTVRYCLVATMFAGQHPRESFDGIAKEMQDISAWASRSLSHPR